MGTRASWGWYVMAVVVVAALVFGATRTSGARTPEQRIDAIAKTLKCPTCRSESVFESRAAAAQNIRDEIARQVSAGQTDDQIRSYINDRFADQGLLLVPGTTGLDSLVWILPVVVLVLAVGGLVLAFRRWRSIGAAAEPTDEDRALVAAARQREGEPEP